MEEMLKHIEEAVARRRGVLSPDKDWCAIGGDLLLHPDKAAELFVTPPGDFLEAIKNEAKAKKFATKRYCQQLYAPGSDPQLGDVIADISFAQEARLKLRDPMRADDDVREHASSFILAVYTLFAMVLHDRTDYEAIYEAALNNFYKFLTARGVRQVYDKGWPGRYANSEIFYPLG